MGKIKLRIGAGKATMSPPVGPILGQYGIPGQPFCQKLNKQVSHLKEGTPIRVSFSSGKEKTVPNVIPYSLDWNALLRSCFFYTGKKRSIYIERVYELALISAEWHNKTGNQDWIKRTCKSFLNQLNSMNCNIEKKEKG